MAVEVLDGGLRTTLQDEGRYGLYHLGVPPSGAMDKFSYRVANALVGNPDNSAALEAVYLGPELVFTEDTVIALTGAGMPAMVNGDAVPAWETLQVRSGDTLSFDYLQAGARTYIAVAGGFEVEPVLGSRSTYTLTGIGGYEGRGLDAGDALTVGPAPQGASGRVGRRVDDRHIPPLPGTRSAAGVGAGAPQAEVELRIIVGLCSYRLTEEAKKGFTSTTWQVTPDADRIGYRYRGGQLEFVERTQPFGAGSDPANVVDTPYPVGSIQVPGGSEPIVLLSDAVTGGGYVTIGTVISPDLDRLAQSKTGDRTRFVAVTLDEALQARHDRARLLDEVREALQ